MSKYSVIARNSQFGEITADCGHNHKTIETAQHCLDKLTAWRNGSTSAKWYNAHVEDQHGNRIEQ